MVGCTGRRWWWVGVGGGCREISEKFPETETLYIFKYRLYAYNFPRISGMNGSFNVVLCNGKMKF